MRLMRQLAFLMSRGIDAIFGAFIGVAFFLTCGGWLLGLGDLFSGYDVIYSAAGFGAAAGVAVGAGLQAVSRGPTKRVASEP